MGAERGRELIERLRREVVVADGAMGTMFYRSGLPLDTCYEALNLERPELVKTVHRQYVVAGAELIETNTFGANARRLEPHGLERRVAEICERGAVLARAVAGDRVPVAGAVGPLGRRPGEELPADAEAIFAEPIEALAAAGVDLLLLETFLDLEELRAAVAAARRLTDLPIVAQFAVMQGGRTPRGVALADAARLALELGCEAFGANCGKGPREVVQAVEELVRHGLPAEEMILTAFPNAGQPEMVGGRYIYVTTPEYMAGAAQRLVAAGVSLVGGCCGTTPADIAAMKVALRGARRVPPSAARDRLRAEQRARTRCVRPAAPISLPLEPEQAPELPAPPPAERLRALRQAQPGAADPVVVVELDAPKDLAIGKMLEGAQQLAEAGVHAITVGDNPLAVMRMSNLAASHLVQQHTGVPVVAHLSCRDRNLIGLQSWLMGAHALGIRSVLAITGDPASVGNQPGATSVYDTNSFGLVELIARLNRGESLIGEPLGERTEFTIGVAFNPNGLRIAGQLRRLQKKARLGAHFAQTQPCYEIRRVREMYEQAAEFGLPLFLGLLPLFNERMAAFVHNEVPGIDVPEQVVKRLAGRSKEQGYAEGLAIVEEIVEGVFDVAHGFYIIPPFNNPRHALAVLERVRRVAARRAAAPLAAGRAAVAG